MGKIRNLCMTQLVRMKKIKEPDMYTWIFSSVDNCYYNYNSRYLFEYVKEHLPQITPIFVINEEGLRRELSKKYGEQYFIETESKEGIRRVLEAGVWFTSAGLPVYGPRLGRNRLIINLWHGVPLKKIALMDPNLKKMSRIYFKKIFSENYTWILTTARELIPVMAKSFQVCEEQIRVWGQPRNDLIFFPPDRKKILGEIYPALPNYQKVILYAPTFRDYGNTRLFPFEDFDKKAFQDFLEKEQIILLLRLHIKEATAAEDFVNSRIRCFGSKEVGDVTGMLGMFDLLITDYSSIYIDYLLTDKPMIFLPYDKERYLDGRGMNFDYEEVTPGPKPKTMKEFTEELRAFCHGEDSWKQKREQVSKKFNEIRRPCSADICKQVLLEIKKRTE